MAGAAPAYQYSYPERLAPRSPRVRVIPGSGQQWQARSLSPALVAFARLVAVVLVVFALLGLLRIGLASATVTTALSAEEVAAKIESARSQGNELEVREGYLSNPTYLKLEAAKLHMGTSDTPTVIMLSEDRVKTDEAGGLSLALSLKAVVAQG